jgi:hypothetical protein
VKYIVFIHINVLYKIFLGQLARKIGLKVLEMGGSAVIG